MTSLDVIFLVVVMAVWAGFWYFSGKNDAYDEYAETLDALIDSAIEREEEYKRLLAEVENRAN